MLTHAIKSLHLFSSLVRSAQIISCHCHCISPNCCKILIAPSDDYACNFLKHLPFCTQIVIPNDNLIASLQTQLNLTSNNSDKLNSTPFIQLNSTKLTIDTINSLGFTKVYISSQLSDNHNINTLNIHCAAYGHPIVGDKVYGINGEAAPNGGLEAGSLSSAAGADVQEAIASAHGVEISQCAFMPIILALSIL